METAARQRKIIPAPVIVALILIAGSLAHHFYGLPFLPHPGIAILIVATLCGLAALAIGIAGVREFHRKHTPTSPFKPTTTLVTSGVFSRTRNPMYLGFVLLALGIALGFNSLPLLVAAALLAALLQRLVIRPEEAFLAARFGAAFDDYRRRTRRWF